MNEEMGNWDYLAGSGSSTVVESSSELDDINHELTDIANRAVREESLGEDPERKIWLESRRKELEG